MSPESPGTYNTRNQGGNTVKKAYSYIRFSTPDQIKGDSLRRQLEASRAYAKAHNLLLDESSYRDLGLSGFSGKNRQVGALKAFIDAIQSGVVEPGSVLILENLDRLSREKPVVAINLWTGILNNGVEIVTVKPEQRLTVDAEPYEIIMAVLESIRASEESRRKSDLVGKSWENKRKQIGTRKMTGRAPAWLKLSKDKTQFEPVADSVAVVKKLFKLALSGHGITSILKTLQNGKVPPIGNQGNSTTWHRSYIVKILRSRAVLGEFQPCTMNNGKRVPVGEPIADYFPRIVSDADFYKAGEQMASRRNSQGRIGKNVTNLFTGIIHNAVDNATMVVIDKGNGPRLISSAAHRGEPGKDNRAVSYAPIELAILTFCSELKASTLQPSKAKVNDLEDSVAATRGKIGDLTRRIKAIQAKMEKDDLGSIDMLVETVHKLNASLVEESQKLKRLEGELGVSKGGSIAETQTLIGLLEETKGEALYHLRLRLRDKIRSLFDDFRVTISVKGMTRHASIAVHKNGSAIRVIHVTCTRSKKPRLVAYSSPSYLTPKP